MKSKYLCLGLFVALLSYQCETVDERFLVGTDHVGPLAKNSSMEQLETLFSQDSVVRDSVQSILGGALTKVSVFEKGGSPLLKFRPSADSVQTVAHVQILDPRYLTDKGVGLHSTFKQIRDNYEIKKVVTSLGNVVVFLKDSPVYFTIDKNELPDNLRYTNKPVEAVQIPDDAQLKFMMVGWE